MTTFDDRERGFEANFARDEELEFKAAARRNRQLGLWAGEKLGLSGEALDAYVRDVMRSDLKEKGDEDVFQKVVGDLDAKRAGVQPHEVRAKMTELLETALEDLHEGR